MRTIDSPFSSAWASWVSICRATSGSWVSWTSYASPTFTGAASTSRKSCRGPCWVSRSSTWASSSSPWGLTSSTACWTVLPVCSFTTFSSSWAGPCSTVGSVASSMESASGSDTSYSAGSTTGLPYSFSAVLAPTRMGICSPFSPLRTPMHPTGSPSCKFWGSHEAGYWASTPGSTGARYTCIRLDASTGSSCFWTGSFSAGFLTGASALAGGSSMGSFSWDFSSSSFWNSSSSPLPPVLGIWVWPAMA